MPVLRACCCSCAAYATIATIRLFCIVDQRANDFFESPPPALVHAVTHHVSVKAYEALILSKQWIIKTFPKSSSSSHCIYTRTSATAHRASVPGARHSSSLSDWYMGFSLPCLALTTRKETPEFHVRCRDSDAESTHHGGWTGPLRVPRPNTREETRDRKRKLLYLVFRNKIHFIHTAVVVQKGNIRSCWCCLCFNCPVSITYLVFVMAWPAE